MLASSPNIDPATMLCPQGEIGGMREGGGRRCADMRRLRLHHTAPAGGEGSRGRRRRDLGSRVRGWRQIWEEIKGS
jgi:hypothetical protein